MNIKHHKLLHYVLIILLMFAPLRSVLAGQFAICDMSSSPSKTSVVAVDASPVKHCQNMMYSASADDRVQYQKKAQGCCDDNNCSGDCHSAISVSLLIQSADYSPTLLGTVTLANISITLLVRELIPPSRPPLSLYS